MYANMKEKIKEVMNSQVFWEAMANCVSTCLPLVSKLKGWNNMSTEKQIECLKEAFNEMPEDEVEKFFCDVFEKMNNEIS